MNSVLRSFLLILFLSTPAWVHAQNQAGPGIRVLLIPLDDRPTSAQLPQRLGLIGNAEVLTPPRELLGKFTQPGQPDNIMAWVKTQEEGGTFDVVIVALDMLAYGGLVGSRMHRVPTAEALRRVDFLRVLKRQMPQAKLYVQNVIIRLAPTPGDTQETYRSRLERWAEVSVGTDAPAKEATAVLEREIPREVLADYQMTRRRNLLVNLKAVELADEGVIEYLILSQDDAKPRGIHVADRERLLDEIQAKGLEQEVAVQPGADEVSMLLLARALAQFHGYSPNIKAVYSSESIRTATMPFEDRPLHQTVSQHIRATGAQEAVGGQSPDVYLFVYASREEPGQAERFAAQLEAELAAGKRIILADIDPRGDVQGGDPHFMDALNRRGLFPRLSGYAAWNTAGNTLGTALAQGMVYTMAEAKLFTGQERSKTLRAAQHWFTLHRVLDDYYFHTLVRGKTNEYLHQQKQSSLIMGDEQTRKAEAFSRNLMLGYFESFTQSYFENGLIGSALSCRASDFQFSLPWNRMFEASIDFTVRCDALK